MCDRSRAHRLLLQQLDWANPVLPSSVVLDLGSGHGGLSHELVQTFGCQVLSFNISPEQNQMNLEEAVRLGIADKITIEQGDFNNGLPAEWSSKFTHVLSCEVFCHAASKPKLLAEIFRVLKPGGAITFTDIMGADGADEKALKDFTDRNATTAMARPAQYRTDLFEAGFVNLGWWDGSAHLGKYFRAMLQVCHDHREAMLAEGVPEKYLGNWVSSLTDRCEIQESKGVFAWGIFSGRKPGPLFTA
jgi:cyclopropane fatty-acyl-phospholipid synthase-like methyltransferase